MSIKYVYIGEGAFVVGVPARDLTDDDEPEALVIAEENSRTANPCYVAVKPMEKKAEKKTADS